MQTQITYNFDNKIAKEQIRGMEQDNHVKNIKSLTLMCLKQNNLHSMFEASSVNVNKECKSSNYLEPRCLTYIKKFLDHKWLE
jgi:hypothetical protein